jgi:hypothetical protein
MPEGGMFLVAVRKDDILVYGFGTPVDCLNHSYVLRLVALEIVFYRGTSLGVVAGGAKQS